MLIGVIVLLAICAAVNWTIIPRPISPDQLGLWLWLKQPIGVHRTPATGTHEYRVTWVFGEARTVRLFDLSGAPPHRPIAAISRPDHERDHFKLDVFRDGVPLRNLIYAFNTLRHDDEIFGIQWARFNPREDSVGPFACEGTMAEIMAAIIGHYGLRVEPLKLVAESPRVCVFVPVHIPLPTHDEALVLLHERRERERFGLFGPEPPDAASPLRQALDRMEYLVSSSPGAESIAPAITGTLHWVTPEQAEALGYRVQKHYGPILLQRLEWDQWWSRWWFW